MYQEGQENDLGNGPFKYYVSKKVGGWGMPNAYVCLHGGWVGGFSKMLM